VVIDESWQAAIVFRRPRLYYQLNCPSPTSNVVSFGVLHFVYPALAPGHSFLVYLTGTALLVFAARIATNTAARQATAG
jgi:hypothetical protein